MKFAVALIFIFCVKNSFEIDVDGLCTTASCVHASSVMLKNMKQALDPCDDFYEYACGSFADELGVPDEKATINTFNTMKERVLEFINGLVFDEVKPDEERNFELSRIFYKSCEEVGKIHQNLFRLKWSNILKTFRLNQ